MALIFSLWLSSDGFEGEHNMLLQNIALWHKYYIRLIVFKKQQTGKTLKTEIKLPFYRRHSRL